ncbi:MAG: flagellar biosynthesis-like protein (FlhF) [Pseudomonadota bacterium]
MRLRTFTGPSLTEAMNQVRREMGADAVIIATNDAPGGGVQVRAAAERAAPPPEEKPEVTVERRERTRKTERGDGAQGLTRIARALSWHRVTEGAAEALMHSACEMEDGEATATLARALDARYSVHPIEHVPQRPLLFAGPPGSGKSSALAKTAARMVSAGVRPIILAADDGAGAREQLNAYAGAMGDLTVEPVGGLRELDAVLNRLTSPAPILIDSAAINPFDLDALERLSDFASAADSEIIAVLEAGIAPEDAEDACAILAAAGAGRAIITKLDAAQRLGALLAPGETGLSYAHISASPFIGSGLAPATALRIARALLDDVALGGAFDAD